MNTNIKTFLMLLAQSILFWSLAYVFMTFIRFAIVSDADLTLSTNVSNPSLSRSIQFGIILGIIVGTFYAIIESVFESIISNKVKLWIKLILKNFVYLIVLVIAITFIRRYNNVLNNVDISDIERGWWLRSKFFLVGIVYFLICSLIFSFIQIANQKFGKGVFLKMLFGRYKKPREENRIFMFLDLKSSTTIAEELGHFKYSQFIQDCFYDLNEVVPKYDAEIYQYVGDEAVLCWNYNKGIKNNNCVDLFFQFDKLLISKSKYYQDKYGYVPQFKAGVHGGKLMVTEVGTVKKEIAFHGDVINTSARIQSECNNYNASLLISEKLLSDLHFDHNYSSTKLGTVKLKGKQQKVAIYDVKHVLLDA